MTLPHDPEDPMGLQLLVAEHAARVEAARLHHAKEAALPVPGALGASLDALTASLQAATADPGHAARIAAEEARRERAERAAITALADARCLPTSAPLRAVATKPTPVVTPAMEAARAVEEWRGRRKVGCFRVLSGSVGVGKSVAAAWVCLWDRPGVTRERTALWMHATELDLHPRNGYSDHAHAWGRWESVPLLVLDELGAERDDLADTVSGLAGRRYDAGLVTLVTTNLPSAAVKARYLTSPAGARLLDRVRMEQALGGAPGGLPGLVTLSGPSLRGRAQGT